MRGITYKQLPSVTYEQELELLARIYALALESYRKQKAAERAPTPDGRDGTTVQGDSADAQIIQE